MMKVVRNQRCDSDDSKIFLPILPSGVHTWQRMFGCQWDDESNAVDYFDQYGYDGEDFISLDLKNLRYIASNQRAVLTKNKWDNDRSDLDRWKHYYFQRCVELLKMYVQYGSSTLGRTGTAAHNTDNCICFTLGRTPVIMLKLKSSSKRYHLFNL